MKRRPGSVTTCAVLNFVFGGLFLLCGVMGLAESKVEFNGRDVSQEMKDFMAREVPGYAVLRMGDPILGLLLAAGLIVSGVGLLTMGNWGRILAAVCAILFILHQLFHCVYQLALVNPATERFLANSPIRIPGLFSGIAGMLTLIWALIVIAYSTTLLILMLLPSTARAFRGGYRKDDEWDDGPPARRRPVRYEDEEDQDDRSPPPRRGRREEDIQEAPPRRRPSRTPPPGEDDE